MMDRVHTISTRTFFIFRQTLAIFDHFFRRRMLNFEKSFWEKMKKIFVQLLVNVLITYLLISHFQNPIFENPVHHYLKAINDFKFEDLKEVYMELDNNFIQKPVYLEQFLESIKEKIPNLEKVELDIYEEIEDNSEYDEICEKFTSEKNLKVEIRNIYKKSESSDSQEWDPSWDDDLENDYNSDDYYEPEPEY